MTFHTLSMCCLLYTSYFFFVKPKNVTPKVCVMLAYNNILGDKGAIVCNQGITDFKYFKRLNNLQKEQGLQFANKLSANYIFYENQKCM